MKSLISSKRINHNRHFKFQNYGAYQKIGVPSFRRSVGHNFSFVQFLCELRIAKQSLRPLKNNIGEINLLKFRPHKIQEISPRVEVTFTEYDHQIVERHFDEGEISSLDTA